MRFSLRLALAESRRRRRSAILLSITVALAVVAIILTQSVASAAADAESSATRPLGSAGSDLLVSRAISADNFGAQASPDLAALQAEQQAASHGLVVDLANLGPPGSSFASDFFLPGTNVTFPADWRASVAAVAGVKSTTEALTLVVTHVTGTVPLIIAEYDPGVITVDLSPPTQAEQSQIRACYVANAPNLPPPPPKTKGSTGPAIPIEMPAAYYACLPARFRQTFIEQEVIHQLVNPPTTDINTTGYNIAGVEANKPAEGLITALQVATGKYLSGPDVNEVLLSTPFAALRHLTVGDDFRITDHMFQVVGLVNPPIGGLAADVYLPLDTLQAMSDRTDRINLLFVRVTNATHVSMVSKRLRALFPGVEVTNSEAVALSASGSLVSVARLSGQLKGLIDILALLTATTIATMVTLASLATRTRELGTLRAIGWTRLRLVGQVLLETLVQGTGGASIGVLGAILAIATAGAIAPRLEVGAVPWSIPGAIGVQLHRPAIAVAVALRPELHPAQVLWAVAIALAAAVFAGCCAGIRASHLAPAEAMRSRG
jgi:ABC-type lipoprotein release transport system permease subunit